MLLAQGVEVTEPFLVALASRRDAIAEPVLLHDDLAAELVALTFLLLENLIAPGLELRKPLVQHAGGPAIQPDCSARYPLQQAPVMADQDDTGAHPGQFLFQPLDSREVQVVGGFVEQQDIGFGSQHACQGSAPSLTARQFLWVFAAGQAELFQQVRRPVMVGRGVMGQAGFDIFKRGSEAGEIRFLRKIADRGAGLRETPTGIGLHQPSGNSQEGGFAGAVAADQANPVTRRDG